ncbi:MAG: hypothetical protein ABI947_29980 [Chloroflexota bacterium]
MADRQTVGEMTLDELLILVQEIVRREVTEQRSSESFTEAERSLDEIFSSIDQNMIILPPSAKSSLELLREDRER